VHQKTQKIWVFVLVFCLEQRGFFFGVFLLFFGLSNSCKCLQYYNLILAGRIAQGTTAVDGLQKKRQILVLCIFDECFCFAFLVVVVIVVIVVLVADVLEGTHECTTARSFVRRILKERAWMRGENEEAAAALVVVLHKN
jgi:hypothetical protein